MNKIFVQVCEARTLRFRKKYVHSPIDSYDKPRPFARPQAALGYPHLVTLLTPQVTSLARDGDTIYRTLWGGAGGGDRWSNGSRGVILYLP